MVSLLLAMVRHSPAGLCGLLESVYGISGDKYRGTRLDGVVRQRR